MRKFLFPLVIGLGGLVVLLWLGIWQVNRLDWKQGVIEDINGRLAAAPVPLQERVLPEVDNYLSVIVEGAATGEEIRFLDSGTAAGTGHHIISAFVTTSGRRIMIDQGLLPLYADQGTPMTEQVTVQGNLIWPDDISDQPPSGDEWYARNVPAMAEVLKTEPILIQLYAASAYDERLTPLQVDTRNIKNDHLEYAITWFLLAVVWAAMTIFYMVRTMRRKDK
ncbi:SURF1 family protein [Octadecabacter sp. 1_MG-2023]|uniref:SURF1 family protein n=1 Tax=unclassified Octadecabacter TaxID=196158 RepID=UPI001C0A6643|nr:MULTISPECIES: SURF1 family protein [unclassified Octadecabacter]MBU2992023.1 SURF1 family protein [Octadecabacter sp. B2R22]MDO6735998.1 SURF1 family protein [Octadecabacter sp. 1_MG-2023]